MESTTSNTTTITTTELQTTKSIPFPVSIGLVIFIIAIIGSKCALPSTIVPAAFCAFSGLAESLSWIIVVLVVTFQDNSEDYPLSVLASYIVVGALVCNLVLNILGACFFRNYLWEDVRVQGHLKRLRNKNCCGACFTYFLLILSVLFSHKIAEILFSNLFEVIQFTYKVEDKLKLTPFNYCRYFSVISSLIAIAGAAIASYEQQPHKMGSLVFIQSIDLIIVTILSAIAAIWVTIRKSDDYENVIT